GLRPLIIIAVRALRIAAYRRHPSGSALNQAARVRRAPPRRRGGVAAHGAGAAGQPHAAHRRAPGTDANEPLVESLVAAFTEALADLGWTDGRNVRVDLRSAGGDINRIRALARLRLRPTRRVSVLIGGRLCRRSEADPERAFGTRGAVDMVSVA